MRDQRNGSFFFSSIKREWAKQSLERSLNHKWSKNINPSSTWLTWEGCPYEGIREAAKPRKANEAEAIQYMEIGNYLHKMFQERALTIPDLLWDKPAFLSDKENEKLNQHWPEIPFMWEEYSVSGRIDLILNKNSQPCVVDLKIPQRLDGPAWVKYRDNLPEDTHMTQSAVGALALKHMGIVAPKSIGVLYFNPYLPPDKDKNYKECYMDFTPELEAKTLLLIQHAKKELDAFLAEEESSCTYPLCKKHKGNLS